MCTKPNCPVDKKQREENRCSLKDLPNMMIIEDHIHRPCLIHREHLVFSLDKPHKYPPKPWINSSPYPDRGPWLYGPSRYTNPGGINWWIEIT